MTGIDKLNLVCTIISIVVTIVSMGFSIWACYSAKKAKRYREETLLLKDVFDLEGLLGRFQIESNLFLEKTRHRDWYKGTDANYIISPFKVTLSMFGRLYHLIENQETLKGKVHELNIIIQTYDKATKAQKGQVTDLILEILDILQSEAHKNTKKIIKN